jgi:hypothetical protein
MWENRYSHLLLAFLLFRFKLDALPCYRLYRGRDLLLPLKGWYPGSGLFSHSDAIFATRDTSRRVGR